MRGIQERCSFFAYYLLCVLAETVGNKVLSEEDIATMMDELTQEYFEFLA
jgi:hypothetical protein